MATVYATDKTAKDDEPKLWFVEDARSMEVAEADAKYIQERVDGERWGIRASYSPRTGEPLWPVTEHMREPENTPQPDAIDPAVKPLW